ncbi:DUF7714 family protein [Methanoregula sp.]|jgi:hypothetical protein|uniref:DUF7714 family protein n=1 Tax=Methanoregula sp. TaxID=2052170 RepID=UPI003C1EFE77
MIFPEHCKYIGRASTKPCGDRVYALSRYLLRDTPEGLELLEITLDPLQKGVMRDISSSRILVSPREIYTYPEKVQLNDRTHLVRLALERGYRCTVFTGLEENMTFVLDPDMSGFLTVHVYDVIPPRPTLSASLSELEGIGFFGDLSVIFDHHVRDISQITADVFPCRAAGYIRTLDADPLYGGERVAGCLTAVQLFTECYGNNFELVNICPLDQILEEPFIARCCRAEREGVGTWNGMFGAIVHWGASPAKIAWSVNEMVRQWRNR